MRILFIVLFYLATLIQPTKIFAQKLYPDSVLKQNGWTEKSRYKFSKNRNVKQVRQACLNGIIDTASIYVLAKYYADYGDTLFSYLRFFSGGEVFTSYLYLSIPGKDEYNNLKYGHWDMYSVKNHNIIIEFYQPLLVGTVYDFAEIKEDRIKFYKSRIGRLSMNSTSPINYELKRYPAEFLNQPLTWNQNH